MKNTIKLKEFKLPKLQEVIIELCCNGKGCIREVFGHYEIITCINQISSKQYEISLNLNNVEDTQNYLSAGRKFNSDISLKSNEFKDLLNWYKSVEIDLNEVIHNQIKMYYLND